MRHTFLVFGLIFASGLARAESCLSVVKEPGKMVDNCGGVNVVRLAGTPAERARKLGELVRNHQLSDATLRYFSEKTTEEAHRALGWLASPLLLTYDQLVRYFHRQAPAAIEEEIDAYALGLGRDAISLRRGMSLPDLAALLEGLGSRPGFEFVPAAGCTSVAASSAEGFSYGRNLDFAGVGVWDRHPMLLVSIPPRESKELPHVAIGADGTPFAGITGVNSAGITFAVHQNFSSDVGLDGVPMPLIGELVLRSAHSLEEAIGLLRQYRPANLWTFVLTDLNHGEAVAVESSRSVFLVRHSNGRSFAQTNHAMHPETRETEVASASLLESSRFRFDQALRMLDGGAPPLRALAWQQSPLGELNANRDVLKALTLQTVMFTKDTLTLSVDEAPASSGRFAEFSLQDLHAGSELAWQPRDPLQTPADVRHRQRTAATAFRMYFDEHKPVEAAALLAADRGIDAALFRCAAMADAGRFSDSLRLATDALSDPRFTGESALLRDSLLRVKLVSLIRLGRAEEARAAAQSVVEGNGRSWSKPLLRLCERLVKRERVPGWMLDLNFDFFSGDLSGRKS